MAAEGANEVRVFDLFVEVADKAEAGQVGGCHFVERADFLLAGGWIIDYNRTGVTPYQSISELYSKLYLASLNL